MASAVRKSRSALWPPRFLKYLLIWPLIAAYRRKTRRKLSWRLAGSHFATVLVSVAAICVVGIVAAVISTRIARPTEGEAAYEAWDVAHIVEGVNKQGSSFSDTELSAVFKGVATGQVIFNNYQRDITIQATAGRQFKNVRSVSLVGPDRTIRASSDPALIGTSTETLDQSARGVVQSALSGQELSNVDALSGKRSDGSIVGAYAVHAANGQVTGAVLVDKTSKALPEGLDLLLLVLTFIAQIGLLLLVLVGVPAIPIGIVFGIRRARAISRPIAHLARTVDEIAAGDLAARVAVQGQDEVSELQRGFNNMGDLLQSTMLTEAEQRAIAEQALTANRELIANVSHELRTPVALIRGHLEALESDPEERDAYVRIALRETDRLERLVEDLFQLSRLEAHQVELDLEPFDAGSAVRSAVESLVEPARREAGLTLTASIGHGDLSCYGDRMRFEQVLLNLIRNAIHFTPEGGIILVAAERAAPGTVTVTVSDTGVGIPADDLPRVFERFYRADHSRARSSGGAGLGLAIAKEMIEAMGGTIAVESVQDEGTVFTILMPAVTVPRDRATTSKVPALVN